MTDAFTSELSGEIDGAHDADDLVGHGGGRGSSRTRWALAVIGALLVAGAFYFALSRSESTSTGSGEVVHGGNLGEHSDARALSEHLAPQLVERPGSPEASIAPGSIPCDDSEAALPQDRAALVYSAKLEWEGTPAVVLGYRVEGPSLARVLLVMAEADCRLIVTQSF